MNNARNKKMRKKRIDVYNFYVLNIRHIYNFSRDCYEFPVVGFSYILSLLICFNPSQKLTCKNFYRRIFVSAHNSFYSFKWGTFSYNHFLVHANSRPQNTKTIS